MQERKKAQRFKQPLQMSYIYELEKFCPQVSTTDLSHDAIQEKNILS